MIRLRAHTWLISNNEKKPTHLDAVRSAIREDYIVVIAGDTAVAFLDVLRHVLANTLDADRFRVRAHAAAFTALQDYPGASLRVFGVTRIVQQIRRDRQGKHLPQKRDGLLAHRVGVAHIRFDYLFEGFLNALQKKVISYRDPRARFPSQICRLDRFFGLLSAVNLLTRSIDLLASDCQCGVYFT